MVTDEMVGKAAVAMCKQAGFDPYERMPNDGPRWKYYMESARAALEAVQPTQNMGVSDEMVEAAHRYICGLYPYPQSKPETRQMLNEAWSVAALSAAEPVKSSFEVASKRIPEARVSLLSRTIRQGLNDYGWKNFGTLPEVLMGYIVEAERAEAEAHPKQPAPSVAVKALHTIDLIVGNVEHEGGGANSARMYAGMLNDIRAVVLSALSAQVQDVAGTVVKLGTYGKAYDMPEERRAYTYDHQPQNNEAYRLGRACSDIHSGGDWIDRGLNLLNALQREGFGVYELPAAPAKQEG